jgi:hypothetical protein
MSESTRRQFLHTATAGCAVGLGGLDFISGLPAVSAAETKLDPKVVRLEPGIEPLVRVLEETPRGKLLEEMADRIHKGTTYREVLAALFLAGVRNVEPRPSVGFKFHAVMVVNSAHLASLASPDAERWLPIFWALDFFKDSQAKNMSETKGWRMAPVDEALVPPARKARQAVIAALDNWDSAAVDPAIAGFVRGAGVDQVLELLWQYAPRDFRDIGHKAIFAANAKRTLDCIGWHHAEPVLRSLAYAFTHYNGANPAKSDEAADRPGRKNRELAKQIPDNWQEGKIADSATVDMLAALREGSDLGACRQAVDLLKKGVAPRSIWDAVLTGASELLMCKPGIVALHAVTSSNALRYAYAQSGNDDTRRWLLLQNAAFVALFRKELLQRERLERLPEHPIDKLEALAPRASGPDAIGEIFADVGKDRQSAARKVLGYLKEHPQPKELMDAARLLVFLKGNETHDYKFSSAVLEDYVNISPGWRGRFLAAAMFQFRGSSEPDNRLVSRTRAALKL